MTESTINVKNIIIEIEEGKLSSKEIMEKYSLTPYRYYKIKGDVKNPHRGLVQKGIPKNTKFKQLLNEGRNEHIDDETSFDMEGFKKDCIDGMKLSELIEKYKLSLYQVRELRKKYDLKTR